MGLDYSVLEYTLTEAWVVQPLRHWVLGHTTVVDVIAALTVGAF